MILDIEQAILAKAKAAGEAGQLGYLFKHRETYPRAWDETLVSSLVKYPAIWVSFVRFTKVDALSSGACVTALFEIVVGANNVRNKTAARKGAIDGSEVGSVQLMLDVITLLQGEDLGLDIGDLELQGAELAADLPEAAVRAGTSVGVLQFSTTFRLEKRLTCTPTAEFLDELKQMNGAIAIGDDVDRDTLNLFPVPEES